MPAAWEIGSPQDGLSEEETKYVEALQRLARTVASSQGELAAQLSTSGSVVSRKLRGITFPDWKSFAQPLAKIASREHDINCDILQTWHNQAQQGHKQRKLRDQLTKIHRHADADVADKDVAPAHLPVPRQEGDRQVSKNPDSAAQELADWIRSLEGNPEAQLAALRQSTEALTPAECAASTVLLGDSGYGEGAGRTLVELFGRDQSHQRVMRFALELLAEYRLPEPAELALRTAMKPSADTP